MNSSEAQVEQRTIGRNVYSGADWLRPVAAKYWPGRPWQEWWDRAADVLGFAFYGIYHLQGAVMNGQWTDTMVRVTVDTDLATFDGCVLTRLVLAAHDLAIRVSVEGAGYRHRTRIYLYPREMSPDRTGPLYARHPTMEQAITRMRSE